MGGMPHPEQAPITRAVRVRTSPPADHKPSGQTRIFRFARALICPLRLAGLTTRGPRPEAELGPTGATATSAVVTYWGSAFRDGGVIDPSMVVQHDSPRKPFPRVWDGRAEMIVILACDQMREALPLSDGRRAVWEIMTNMSTGTTPGDSRQPGRADTSEHDARELVERLRSAPAEEIITDLFSTLLSAAQVKLGRRDARLFIDLCAQALEYAGRYVPDELGKQVETALGQLRLAQVSAENEGAKGEPEPNDLSQIPKPPTVGNRVEADSGHQSASPASKLWVPGQ